MFIHEIVILLILTFPYVFADCERHAISRSPPTLPESYLIMLLALTLTKIYRPPRAHGVRALQCRERDQPPLNLSDIPLHPHQSASGFSDRFDNESGQVLNSHSFAIGTGATALL